jgi:hypothetical protein
MSIRPCKPARATATPKQQVINKLKNFSHTIGQSKISVLLRITTNNTCMVALQI